MKFRILPSLALVFALSGTLLHAQVDPGRRSGQPLPAEIRGAERTLNAFHQALRSGNRLAALELLADDALIYESGHAERKAEYAAHHLDANIAFATQVPAKPVKRSGGMAGQLVWLTSDGRTTGTFKGKAVDRRTVETALLRLEAGKWVIAHLHWSSAAAK